MKYVLLILVSILFIDILFAQTVTTPSGSGTQDDPYQITILNNLYWITQNSSAWSAVYQQTSDIDATTSSSWASGAGFSPIGNTTILFTGTYDGQNFKIINLHIYQPSGYNYIGLFGVTYNATIKNIKLENANITGYYIVGALIGEQWGDNSSNTITNCYSSGSVVGTGGQYAKIGGLIGQQNSTITNCYSTCTVTFLSFGRAPARGGGLIGVQGGGCATNCYFSGSVTGGANALLGENIGIGGLMGQQGGGYAINCYSTGSVTGGISAYAGGLIGFQASSIDSNCYSTCSVAGGVSAFIGGLIGVLYGGTASSCYSTGCVTGGTHALIGGLIGQQSGQNNTVTNCFWDIVSSSQGTSAGGTGEITVAMKNENVFINAGWNFTTIWKINSSVNNGYPYLMSGPITCNGFTIGSRIKAADYGTKVRNEQLSNVLYTQDGGVHGTIIGGPLSGTAGGFSGNWWKIEWDAEPPDQNQVQGYCSESMISLAFLSGDIPQPDFSGSCYSSVTNIFWKNGFAPSSMNPPNPKLGSALGNCTWYAYGRMLELGFSNAQLSALQGDASKWDDEALAAHISIDGPPLVGSIAQTDAAANGLGHVAIVESVNSDSTITVTESSWDTSLSSTWNFVWRHRTVSSSWFSKYIRVLKATSVPIESFLSTHFSLNQNYPNPFNPNTIISFCIPVRSRVTLNIYDLFGREIAILVNNEMMSAGSYARIWYASAISSGIYFCRIEAGNYTDVKKLVLLK